MTFGQKLRELREAEGMSRRALASASGVPFGTLHGYEMGRRGPTLAATFKLCAALGVECTAFAACTDVADEPPAPEAKPAAKKGKGKK